MKPFFITGTGTSIGKTVVTTSLCWQLHKKNRAVTALKPVISGYDPRDMESDSALILKSCSITPTPVLMETISPWRYATPLAPNMAAAREGGEVDMEQLVNFCREYALLASDYLLVEGAGGVMAPVNNRYTMLDWMQALDWPVILVTGSYLGSISHTLTAYEALGMRSIKVHAVIVSESEISTVDLDETVTTMEMFLPKTIPIVKIFRIISNDDIWKQMPSISWLCDE
jgi:dethiobiotin synthetase